MTIVDADTKFRKIWGPYSTKTYDSHFMLYQKEWLEENMHGAVIIGDGHFAMLKDKIRGVHFVANKNESSAKNVNDEDGVGFEVLTRKEKSLNKAIKAQRARVENPFAQLKAKWLALGKPWAEDMEQQGYLLFMAAAVHNMGI